MTSVSDDDEHAVAPHPTMRQVAQLAGVGLKTVSRVVNGEPHVSEETALRVEEAIRTLNYHPDVQAGNLRRHEKKSRTLGLMLGANPNPFSAALHWAVERVAMDHDSMVLASSLDGDQSHERRAITAMMGRRLDGLLIATATRSHDYLRPGQERGMAVVFVDGMPIGVDADAVLSDNRASAAQATRHLLERGHRRIAYFGARHDVFTIAERRQGVLDELERAGIPASSAVLVDDLDEETAQGALRHVMLSEDPPTAILGGQNLATRGVIRALRELGLHRTTALVSVDDIDLFDLLEPAITVVAQDPDAMGTVAAERVFARLAGDRSPSQRIVIPTRLIERGSGEIPPGSTAR
jgi:DNA-binding LacI/PurR family transcriptional regulator